jgi:colanic acid biosynthesis glycosyl transferase WcaI
VDRNTEVGLLVQDARCGICVAPEDAAGLSRAIFELYRDPAARREMGARGRDFVVNHYSRRVAAGQYHGLIERFVRRRRP